MTSLSGFSFSRFSGIQQKAKCVGITKCTGAFSQWPGRKDMPVAEAGHGIDADQIKIPRQAVMLKAVVEDQNFGIEDGDGVMPDDPTIFTGEYRHAGSMCRKNEGFVSRDFDIRVNSRSIRHDGDCRASLSAIAATRQNDAVPSTRQTRC
jgi:hypothetical protein